MIAIPRVCGISPLAFSVAVGSAVVVGRPSFVIFIADDMGWDHWRAYSHTNIRTPNIDRLAREGMRSMISYRARTFCGQTPSTANPASNFGRSNRASYGSP